MRKAKKRLSKAKLSFSSKKSSRRSKKSEISSRSIFRRLQKDQKRTAKPRLKRRSARVQLSHFFEEHGLRVKQVFSVFTFGKGDRLTFTHANALKLVTKCLPKSKRTVNEFLHEARFKVQLRVLSTGRKYFKVYSSVWPAKEQPRIDTPGDSFTRSIERSIDHVKEQYRLHGARGTEETEPGKIHKLTIVRTGRKREKSSHSTKKARK